MFYTSLVHHRHMIGQGQRFDLVVRDIKNRQIHLPLDAPQLGPEFVPQPGIQVAQRLVEQQKAGIVNQSTSQCDPLLLSSAELGRGSFLVACQPYHLEDLIDLLCRITLGNSSHLQRVTHVLLDGHMRPNSIGLEYQTEISLFGGNKSVPRNGDNGLAKNRDLAPVRELQTGDYFEGGALTATARTEERQGFSAANLEANSVEGDRMAVGFRQLFNFEDNLRHDLLVAPGTLAAQAPRIFRDTNP